jgi:rSAM/selenodomain-associated transferase 1
MGKVKSRLAHTVGEETALAIYYRLLEHTRRITEDLPFQKVLYYSEYVDTEDHWSNSLYQKTKQSEGHLGDKMKQAFEAAFAQGCDAAVVIGTDCMELSSDIITEAFTSLSADDAVIGPAADGGYYLLGLKAFYPEVFDKKIWSSETVLRDTESDFARLNLKWRRLPVLRDVDTFEDLNDTLKTILIRNRGTSNSPKYG